MKDCIAPVRDAYIKEALLRGAAELGADPSEGLFDNWVPQADLCNEEFWTGVSCDSSEWPAPPGGVVSWGLNIILKFTTPLTGSLPSSWGALGQLVRVIDMEFGYDPAEIKWGLPPNNACLLASPFIPGAWANLTNLRSLRLFNLGLKGPVPLHIFSKMPYLYYVQLSHNNFTTLPAPPVGMFTKFGTLSVAFNMLRGKLPELQEGALSGLQGLDLSHNMLTGNLPASYGTNLKALESLNLDYNAFDTLEIEPSSFPLLSRLQMAHNQLVGPMPSVLQLKSAARVDLSHNSLTALPDVWWNNMPIDKLWAHFNNYMEVLAHHNKISGSLPPLVSTPGANGTFKLSADLSFNELSGSISATGRAAGIRRQGYLIATHNSLSGTLPPNLMHWFSGAVDLSHNKLSGPCCPEAWHRWESLLGLYLEHNMLRGPLPSIYANWNTLVALDLASNPLNTTIPPSFLGSYVYKEVAMNVVGGSVYETHGAIRQVYLSNCSLHGTLPMAWLKRLLSEGHALAIHDNPDLKGCLPALPPVANRPTWQQGSCRLPGPNPPYDCSQLFLVKRNASCSACFEGGGPWWLRYPTHTHDDLRARFDCSQIEELDFASKSWQARQMCDMWLAWPNNTATAGGACTGDWCAAIAGTRVTGVCQP